MVQGSNIEELGSSDSNVLEKKKQNRKKNEEAQGLDRNLKVCVY